MPRTEQIRQRLKPPLAALGMSQKELCGINRSSTAQFKPIHQWSPWYRFTVSGVTLTATLAPVLVDFRNAPVVRNLVSKMNKGALEIRITEPAFQPS